MDYSSHLKELLTPLGLYNLDSGPGADELDAQGAALDRILSSLELLEKEAFLHTAEDFGLSSYESLLPAYAKASSADERRKAVAFLLMINDSSFSPNTLINTAKIFGINIAVAENPASCLVTISFPGISGVPADFDNIQWIIDSLIPCHLEVSYKLNVITWASLEAVFTNFSLIEIIITSWSKLEAFA